MRLSATVVHSFEWYQMRFYSQKMDKQIANTVIVEPETKGSAFPDFNSTVVVCTVRLVAFKILSYLLDELIGISPVRDSI